jgi:hypothetical protein
METNLRGEMTEATDVPQLSLTQDGFIRAIASTSRASIVKVSHNIYFL